MRNLFLFVFFLPLLVFAQEETACWSAEPNEYWSIGAARNLNGELLYCEFHKADAATGQHAVVYRAPDGEVIAEKEITWDASRTRPQVVQRDFRSGELIQVEATGEWRLIYRKDHAAEEKQVRLSSAEVDVVDAGFDQKVRDHWDQLLSGNRLRVQFAAPAFQRAVPLRVTYREPRYCPNASAEDEVCFLVEADNALVRLFVDPLRLSYDRQRRLRVFEGVVNIRDQDGKKQTAVITYRYVGDGKNG